MRVVFNTQLVSQFFGHLFPAPSDHGILREVIRFTNFNLGMVVNGHHQKIALVALDCLPAVKIAFNPTMFFVIHDISPSYFCLPDEEISPRQRHSNQLTARSPVSRNI